MDNNVCNFACPDCKYKTEKKINFSRHLKSAHHNSSVSINKIENYTYNCIECDFHTNKRFDYTRHIRSTKHTRNNKSATSSEITPSVSVVSLNSSDNSLTDEEYDEDNERISVKNIITGEIRYSSNAPKRKNLDSWLEDHREWEIYNHKKRISKNERISQLVKKLLSLIEEIV
jgi:hypothetical protein